MRQNFLFLIHKTVCLLIQSTFSFIEIESYSRKHSKSIFKDKEKYEQLKRQQGPFGDQIDGQPSFFSVCKEEECDNKSAAELY